MDKDPETLEEALQAIKSWKIAYSEKLNEITEMNDELARVRAEARAEALKEAVARARSAILGFGKPRAASDRYSPMIRKDMAAQLAERAILADEPKEERGAEVHIFRGPATEEERKANIARHRAEVELHIEEAGR